MRQRLWNAVIIFLSAYAPLPVIFCIQDIDLYSWQLKHPIIVIVLLTISILSIITLWLTMRSIRHGAPPVEVVKVKNRSTELVNYSIPYMISFFVMDMGDTNLLISFLVFMLLLFIVTYRTSNIFVNPILAMFGYNLYDIVYKSDGHEREGQVLVKKHKPVAKDRIRIIRVSDFLFLATDINPEV